jgi:hypothetical protein
MLLVECWNISRWQDFAEFWFWRHLHDIKGRQQCDKQFFSGNKFWQNQKALSHRPGFSWQNDANFMAIRPIFIKLRHFTQTCFKCSELKKKIFSDLFQILPIYTLFNADYEIHIHFSLFPPVLRMQRSKVKIFLIRVHVQFHYLKNHKSATGELICTFYVALERLNKGLSNDAKRCSLASSFRPKIKFVANIG